jgi:hypothetical protein
MPHHRPTALAIAALAALWLAGCGPLGFGDEDDDDTSGQPDDDTSTDDDDDTSTGDDDTTAGDDDDDTTAGDDDTTPGDDDDDTGEALLELVYFLDLADESFDFVEPAGLGFLLQSQIPEDDGAVFTATSMVGGTVNMLFGAAMVLNPAGHPDDWIWEQTDHDTSNASGSWASLQYDVGPFAMVIEIDGTDVWFGDAWFSGTYAADGSEITDVDMSFMVDTTPLDEIVGMDICSMAACTTCPAGCPNPGDGCVQVNATGGTCPLLEGLYLVEMP